MQAQKTYRTDSLENLSRIARQVYEISINKCLANEAHKQPHRQKAISKDQNGIEDCIKISFVYVQF